MRKYIFICLALRDIDFNFARLCHGKILGNVIMWEFF